MDKYHPDLIILDIFYMALAIPFTSLNVPILLANAQLVGDKDINFPPLESDIIPNNTESSRKKIENAWNFIVKKKEGLNSYFEMIEEISKKI